jgi:hypothetical protein
MRHEIGRVARAEASFDTLEKERMLFMPAHALPSPIGVRAESTAVAPLYHAPLRSRERMCAASNEAPRRSDEVCSRGRAPEDASKKYLFFP